nr:MULTISPECIES: hypothetical protein [unclassified Actinomyces]
MWASPGPVVPRAVSRQPGPRVAAWGTVPSPTTRRLGLLVSPDPLDRAGRASLTPAGPTWFPAVMGTGILANVLQLSQGRLSGAATAAVAVLALAWCLLVGLVVGYLLRLARDPGLLGRELSSPFWGTVAMGWMSVGSATGVVTAAHWPRAAGTAWGVDLALWVAGTALGLTAEAGYLWRRAHGTEQAPSFVSCLAVLAPMVSSTVGAVVSEHLPGPWRAAVLVTSALCWLVSLVLGWLIFLPAYSRTLRRVPLPLAGSASAVIPLGVVGQSVAGAVAISTQAQDLLPDGVARLALAAAHAWGWLMLVLGVPMAAWGGLVYARGLWRRMPFTPGWFGATFPIGTLALGGILLGRSTAAEPVTWMGQAAVLVLVGTVSLALAGAVLRLVREPRQA